jgi:hypothetical protein
VKLQEPLEILVERFRDKRGHRVITPHSI